MQGHLAILKAQYFLDAESLPQRLVHLGTGYHTEQVLSKFEVMSTMLGIPNFYLSGCSKISLEFEVLYSLGKAEKKNQKYCKQNNHLI